MSEVIVVICPVCDSIQEEVIPRKNDKFAWQCHNCTSIIENNQPYILDTELKETHYRQVKHYHSMKNIQYRPRNIFIVD